MQVGVGKIVGRVGTSWWVQVHDFTKEDDRLVAIITLKRGETESEIEIVERGREVLSRLHELYYGGTEKSSYERLKKTVAMILSEDAAVELTCASIINDVVYLVLNSGAVWTVIGQKEGWIFPNPKKEEVRFGSGRIKNDQTIILGNRLFWDNIPQGMIRVADVESLSAVICGNEKEEGAAGLMLKPEESFEEVGHLEEEEKESETKVNFLDKFRPKDIYISHENTPNSKFKLWLGVGVLVFLLFSVGVGFWRKSGLDFKESLVSKQMEAVDYKFKEAKSVVTLNPDRSRQLLIEVKDLLANLKKQPDQKLVSSLVLSIEKEYQSIYEKSIGVVRPESIELLDLTLTRDGLRADSLVFVDNRIVGLDLVNPRLFSIDPKKKSVQMMAGPSDLGKPLWLAGYPGKVLVGAEKSLVVCPAFQGSCAVKGIPDMVPDVVDAEMFSANLYLLNSSGIWKYQGSDSGFGAKQTWLAEPEKVTLAGSSSFVVDGNVWLIRGDEILKFIRGSKQNFVLSGLDNIWEKQAKVFTNENESNLYVWDKINSRIVIINKEGKYLSQIISESIGKAQSIVFDFANKKLFVGVENKILEIDL